MADSTAAINAFLNGINAIWERELSVHMNLVNAPNVVYAGDASNYQRYKQLVQASNLKYTEQQLDDATGDFGNKSSSWKNWNSSMHIKSQTWG